MRPILFFFILVLAAPALADDDHDRARAAMMRGEILPLSRILAMAERDVGGRVIEVDLERKGDRYIYEVEVVSRSGRLVELSIDAASGAVLERDEDD